MSGTISPRNQRLVAQPSGNRCAFPNCRKVLLAPATGRSRAVFLGELAHIRGENPGSARYDAGMTEKERNQAENLILLCLEHHTLIDGQPEQYSVETLCTMKADHEAWVNERLSEASTTLTFHELEVVALALISAEGTETLDLALTPPREKLRRNGLGRKVERLITIGMVNSPLVGRYIQAVTGVDSRFADRLTTGFTREYRRLREANLASDELFRAMIEFATQGSVDFERQAAGLSVLTYLFEKCEVFER